MKIKNIILSFLIVLTLASVGQCAEFLVKAQGHWMDEYTENEIQEESIHKFINVRLRMPTTKEENKIREYSSIKYNSRYQVGDIVDVFPDGKLSDYAHAGGKFYVIRVVGLPLEAAKKYISSDDEIILTNGVRENRVLKKRKYKIRAFDLPLSVKKRLQKTYVYNTTWDKVKSFVHNKTTGENE